MNKVLYIKPLPEKNQRYNVDFNNIYPIGTVLEIVTKEAMPLIDPECADHGGWGKTIFFVKLDERGKEHALIDPFPIYSEEAHCFRKIENET